MKDWKEIWPDRVSTSGLVKRGLTQEQKTEVYIHMARQEHGSKYQYDKFVFTGVMSKSIITCSVHGDFEQSPNNHISKGSGCKKCSGNERSNTSEFIKKAKEVHGDKYEYANAQYTRALDRITVTCKIHGDFHQTADSHLHGVGCPSCAGRVFGNLYLLHYYDNVYKIGITNNVTKRVNELALAFGSPIRIVGQWKIEDTRNMEQYLLNKYTSKPMLDSTFSGYTELRALTDSEVEEICLFLETI